MGDPAEPPACRLVFHADSKTGIHKDCYLCPGTDDRESPVKDLKTSVFERAVSDANRFLENEYRDLFNQKFCVEPEAGSIFVPLAENADIDSILCIKHTRKTDAAGVFSFKNRCFQILDRGFPVKTALAERFQISIQAFILCHKQTDNFTSGIGLT